MTDQFIKEQMYLKGASPKTIVWHRIAVLGESRRLNVRPRLKHCKPKSRCRRVDFGVCLATK